MRSTLIAAIRALAANLAFLLAIAGATTFAQMENVYIGVDSRETITFGTYLGLPNPNKDRLTFLYAHWNEESPSSNHFHGIGVHSYEGEPSDATPTTTNGNNRLPETYTGQAPLTLQPGTGELAGKLVSGENGEHYSDLTFHNIHDLAGYGDEAPQTFMYNSSAQGYQTVLDGLELAIELTSMTPGLFLGTEGLSEAGQMLTIGGPDALPSEPLFWTDETASPGTYSAEFQLVDLSGTFLSSGTINLDFAVVPEPGAAALTLFASAVFALAYRRKRFASNS